MAPTAIAAVPATTDAATTSAPAAAATTSSVPQARSAAFAGPTSGNEVAIAIADNDGKAAAYVCDGASIEAWMQGTVTGDSITRTGRNGSGLTGSLSGTAVFGTVSAGSRGSLPFAAQESQPPAGVYQYRKEINGLATRVGWAVLPDGTQVGLATSGTTTSPAPQLDPATGAFTLGGTPLTASPVGGSDTVVGP